MYRLETCHSWNAEPWKTDFSCRIRKLEQYHKKGYRNVVYLAKAGDQSTFRYRAYNMCHALDGSDVWRGNCFYAGELLKLTERLDWIDIIVLVRYSWTIELDYFIRSCKAVSIPVMFDIDDYIFDLSQIRSVLEAQGVKNPGQDDLNLWYSVISEIRKTALMSDGYITTTDVLADLLKNTFQKESYVLENGFNRWQGQVSDTYYQKKREGTGKSDGILMGYFSGSLTHREDLKVAMDELNDLFYIVPDLRLRIVGYMELDEKMKQWKQEGRIEIFPLQNFVDLQRLIAEVDINLIPLVDNVFTNAKSELKYFEAAICGTISCASPRYVYRNVIKNGVNGYLCDNGEWFSTIYHLCKHGIDWSIAERARMTSIQRYAWYNQRPRLEYVLETICMKRH